MTNITGTSNSEGLAGTNNADLIRGWVGNHTIFGGIVTDSLIGGLGNDTYIVDQTSDCQGTDTLKSSVQFTLGNERENLFLIGSNAISATGNNLKNMITDNSGNSGNDKFRGGAGKKTMTSTNNDIGVIGDVDTLTGKTESDTFSLVTSTGTPTYSFDRDPDIEGYGMILMISIKRKKIK